MQTSKPRTAITWKAYDSITALPPGFWNEKVARSDLSKYGEFIRLVEKHASNAKFLCLVAYLDEQIVACAYFTLSERDLTEYLPAPVAFAVRKIRWGLPKFLFRNVVAAGAEVTDGEHWWYDASCWDWQQFFSDLNRQIQRYRRNVDWTVFRSYVLKEGSLSDEVRSLYRASGFVERDELLSAELTLKEGVATEEDYLNSLNQRHRYTVRKALRKKEKYGLQYEDVESFSHLIDEIYPLYLATWDNAKEFPTAVVPKAFFEDLSKEKEVHPCIQVVRDRHGKIVSFGLTVQNDLELQLAFVGMDYTMNREMSLIYHTYWQSIARAIRKGIRHVHLGVTTYFVKQKFGAELYPTICFFRSRNPVMNYVRSCVGRRSQVTETQNGDG